MTFEEKIKKARQEGSIAFHQGIEKTASPYKKIEGILESVSGELGCIEGIKTEYFAWSVGWTESRACKIYAENCIAEINRK